MIPSFSTAFRDRIALQAGVLYEGATAAAAVLGLTNGGWTFDEGAEIAQVENDGLLVPFEANDRILSYAPKLSGTLIGMSLANLTKLIPGSTSSTVSGTTTITPIAANALLPTSAYLTDVRMVVEIVDGKYLSVRFKKALAKFTQIKTAKNTSAEYSAEIWARGAISNLPGGAFGTPFVYEELSGLTMPA